MNSLREFVSNNDEYRCNEGSNNSLVNSLFEECKVEDYDNETLSNVMRSLEAEIAPVHGHISQTEESSNSYQEETMLSQLMEQMNGCSASQDWDFPCAESTSNWSLEDIEYMMMVDGVNECEEVDEEYSLSYPSIPFEDDHYNSLWNCSNEFMIYE
ncbi:hypothetical protein LIER_27772 [Lithospermum erythrorhizon]|uniref:Uncharacterized protein n=1 Tax=Lithospermum erythrorhizon TaxID=34254 RepID=A0AAV3REX5_LITER